MLRWVLGVSFLGMALWMLVPDKLDADTLAVAPRWGVFGSTALAFFLAEMGDKTQIATVALAAQTHAVLSIVLGTTFGMLLANVPAVLVGDRLAARLPVRLMHALAALLFAALGLYALCGAALPGV
jgi:putative Ca2+/H+ antiporter (TMEM165/GDT1 family)